MADVERIWKHFHRELRQFILRKTKSQSDTDDILQEVFLKIVQNSGKVFRAQNAKHYLYAIVRNAIFDHFRNKPGEALRNELPDVLSEDESQSLNSIVADCCVRPFVDKLPEKYRQALLMAEFHDVPQKEIAVKLNISYSGAKSRVQRGREKLRELIVACCPYRSDAYGNLLESDQTGCNCK